MGKKRGGYTHHLKIKCLKEGLDENRGHTRMLHGKIRLLEAKLEHLDAYISSLAMRTRELRKENELTQKFLRKWVR